MIVVKRVEHIKNAMGVITNIRLSVKIFVSVVSFRDPLLLQTVRSLIDNQSGIYEIVVGIFEQTCIEDSLLTLDKSLTE